MPGCDVKIKYRQLKDIEIQKIKKLKSELETLAKKKKELKSLSDEWKQCLDDEIDALYVDDIIIYERINKRFYAKFISFKLQILKFKLNFYVFS